MTATTTSTTHREPLLSFPDTVNEVAARLVAGGVVLMAVAAVVFDLQWLTLVLAYGFLARVLAGPKLSPLALLVTRVVVPRLGIAPRPVPGPPKRFAQGIGATVTVAAVLLTYAFDAWGAAQVLLGLMVIAASLEAFAGYCIGCRVYRGLRLLGIAPQDACEHCDEVQGRAA